MTRQKERRVARRHPNNLLLNSHQPINSLIRRGKTKHKVTNNSQPKARRLK